MTLKKSKTPPAPLGCVIMASGQGRRFGGNKLMAPLAGRPLIEWVLDATEQLFARRVVVTRHADVAALCGRRGAEVVLHEMPGRNDTVRLGLDAVGGAVSGCLFCPADQPLLTRQSLLAMTREAADRPDKVIRLAWEGVPGSPALFPKHLFARLRQLPPGKGGGYLIRQLSEEAGGEFSAPVCLVSAQRECELWDVDRPEDLARAAEYLANAAK